MDDASFSSHVSSDVYDFHSDDSEVVTNLHEDYGISLIDLLTDLASECPAASEYAAQQLRTCMIRPQTQEYIRNCFIRSSFEESVSTTPVLFQEQAHRIRLFKRLVDNFPEIISDPLIDLDSEKRRKVMTITLSVFKFADELKYPFVYRAVQSEPLFSRLISRYRDASESVRSEWIKMGFVILDTKLNTNGLLDEVSRCFKDMLMRESVAEVRMEALSAVHEAVICKMDSSMDMDLVMALIHREGDKCREIRIQAISAVQKVYERIAKSEPDHKHRYKIASSMFLLYKKTKSHEEQYTIERAMYQSAFDVMEPDSAIRARNVFNVMLRCTNKAVAAIGAAVSTAKSLRITFLKILIAMGEGNRSNQRRHIQKLATHFDWHSNPTKSFASIVSLIDDSFFSDLVRVFSDASDITYEETTDVVRRFANLTDGTPLEDLHYHFLIRSCVFLNEQIFHKNLMDMMDERMIAGADVVRCSSLLLFWMTIYDRFFEEETVQEYLKSILQRNPECLRILWSAKDKLTLSDDFWNACLPQQPDLSDHLSDHSGSTIPVSVASEADSGESPVDMEIDDEATTKSGAVDETLEAAFKTMQDASLSLVGEPVLSEESSTPDQSQGATDMSLS